MTPIDARNSTYAASGAGLWAAVALKSPEAAKSRLRPLLNEAERREVFFIMARKVLAALKATPGVLKVLVVTASREVECFAARLGAEVVRQPGDLGTAAAFAHAIVDLAARQPAQRPDRLLMIAGDLPLISPTALSMLVQQPAGSGVCLVPDHKHIGTNALLCAPPDAIPPCFGTDSLRRHLEAARARGIVVRVLESEALSLDIDDAADLALLAARPDFVSASGRDAWPEAAIPTRIAEMSSSYAAGCFADTVQLEEDLYS